VLFHCEDIIKHGIACQHKNALQAKKSDLDILDKYWDNPYSQQHRKGESHMVNLILSCTVITKEGNILHFLNYEEGISFFYKHPGSRITFSHQKPVLKKAG
jgi:hypothetical protein